MEVIFNDIAMLYLFSNKYEAIEKIKMGIEVLICLRKQDTSFKLCSQEKITGLEIAPKYYFAQLFNESGSVLNCNYKTALKTFFVNFNKIVCENEKFIFEEKESLQCGKAYKKNGLVFSLETIDAFGSQKIAGQYTYDNVNKIDAEIANISRKEHIGFHNVKLKNRIYEANPKHKANYGWGSIMDLEDSEAQFVLDRAIVAENDERHLIAKYKNVYYSFRCHWKQFYHGYQDNTMPEDMKRKLVEIIPNT